MKLSTFQALSEITQSWIPSPSTLERARQLHAVILTSTTPTTPPFPYNLLIPLYVKSGSPRDALKVFDTMPHRNLVSYNSAITACSRPPAALKLFSEMQRIGHRPSGLTFARILRVSADAKDLPLGAAIHSKIQSSGCSRDVWVQTALLGLYSNCGDVESANHVFCEMDEKDIVAWNVVIHANVRNGNACEGLRLFATLTNEGVIPTEFTFSMALSACRGLADRHVGEIIHTQIVKSEYLIDTPLQNSLLVMYASSGDFPAALRVLDEMDVPELVSWNSVISGYSDDGDAENAMRVFAELLSTSSSGIRPDDYTYAAVVSATLDLPAMRYGKPLHTQVEKSGLACSIYVSSTLIEMYFNNQEPEAACKIFNLIPVKDHILWTAMIVGHSRAGEGEIAVRYFHGMIGEGHEVDSFSLSSALNSCANLGRLKQGQMVHSLALKTGYHADICVCGSLIDVYAKNGSLQSACLAFELFDTPDLKCWNVMLGAYGNHGHSKRAFQLFERLIESGLVPDHVTFLTLLSACCHSGMLEKGRLYWESMIRRGIPPSSKHYSCMVNVISRSGLLQEAQDLILASPFSDGFPEMWRALLSSCITFKEFDVGISASERLLMMDPDDGSTLILLSNLYASVGRWEDVSNIRRRIRELMLDKDPGLSWFENEDKVHVFSADDEFYLQAEDAQAELLKLHRNLKPLDESDLINIDYNV